MKLRSEFGFKHAANGDGQESQNQNGAQGNGCRAFIRRCTLELTSSQEPALYQNSNAMRQGCFGTLGFTTAVLTFSSASCRICRFLRVMASEPSRMCFGYELLVWGN